jgi:hypothetical protein
MRTLRQWNRRCQRGERRDREKKVGHQRLLPMDA